MVTGHFARRCWQEWVSGNTFWEGIYQIRETDLKIGTFATPAEVQQLVLPSRLAGIPKTTAANVETKRHTK